MKSSFGFQQILIVLLALTIAQFACNLGAQPSSTGSQETPASVAQATQPPQATVSERGTPDEARAMLQKAIARYNSVGREQALADFNGKVEPFFDRDLYVSCISSNRLITANGGFPSLVGSSADGVITTDGQPLGKETWDTASTSDIKSVNYQWTNPVSGQTEPKTFFYLRFSPDDVCGVGAYNP